MSSMSVSGREGTAYRVTREQIYPLLREARDRGFFEVRAPLEHRLHQRISDVFGCNVAHVDVVPARHEVARDLVASQAASACVRIIKALALTKKDGEVHVGLGAGATTLSVARHLAAKLRAEETRPRVVLHALTSGFHVDNPHTSPVAFFGLFQELQEQIGYVGLFAPSVVKTSDYSKAKTQPGVKEGFDRKKEIDVVITSLASRRRSGWRPQPRVTERQAGPSTPRTERLVGRCPISTLLGYRSNPASDTPSSGHALRGERAREAGPTEGQARHPGRRPLSKVRTHQRGCTAPADDQPAAEALDAPGS